MAARSHECRDMPRRARAARRPCAVEMAARSHECRDDEIMLDYGRYDRVEMAARSHECRDESHDAG